MAMGRGGRMAVKVGRGVCLLIVLACLGLWVRSWQTTDLARHWTADGRYYEVVTIPGQVRIVWGRGWVGGDMPWQWLHFRPVPPWIAILGQRNLSKQWYLYGTGLRPYTTAVPTWHMGLQSSFRMMVTYRIVAIPLSLPAFLASLPFGWTILRRGHRRRVWEARVAANLCVECGYDLRASRDRCPECGTAIPRRGSEAVTGPPNRAS